MATRVTLECTAERWVWTVFDGDKEIARHSMKLDPCGARGEQKGDLQEVLDDDELAWAIEERDPLYICRHLEKCST